MVGMPKRFMHHNRVGSRFRWSFNRRIRTAKEFVHGGVPAKRNKLKLPILGNTYNFNTLVIPHIRFLRDYLRLRTNKGKLIYSSYSVFVGGIIYLIVIQFKVKQIYARLWNVVVHIYFSPNKIFLDLTYS